MNHTEVKLFTTLGCHLCEQVEAMFNYLQQQEPNVVSIKLIKVEIAESPELMDLYDIRIPVLKRDSQELGWPFEIEELKAFLL